MGRKAKPQAAGLARDLLAVALGAAAMTISGCTVPAMLAPASSTHANTPTANLASGTAARASTEAPATKMPDGVPLGQPADMCTYWDKDLQMVADPCRHGEKMPCLVGRLIILDKANKPVCCDGTMIVTLYNDQPTQGGEPVVLERMDISTDNLRKMISKDALRMWGYTLALPTETCPLGPSKIHVSVEFKPAGGNPLYANSGSFKLKSIASNYSSRQEVPAAANTPPSQPQQAVQAQYQGGQPQQQPVMPQLQFQPGAR